MFTVQGSLGAVPEYKNTGTPQKLGTKLVSKDKIGVSFAAALAGVTQYSPPPPICFNATYIS